MLNSEGILSDTRNPIVIAECRRALLALNEKCRSLQVAAFATDDGFEITRYPAGADDDQRLTSMASSLQALTEAVAHDRGLGDNQYSLIEAEHGRVLLRRVPGQTFVLLAVFGNEESPGQAISISRSVLTDLSMVLPPTPGN